MTNVSGPGLNRRVRLSTMERTERTAAGQPGLGFSIPDAELELDRRRFLALVPVTVLGVAGFALAEDPVLKARPKHVTARTVEAIRDGLNFLKRTQNKGDGSWKSAGGYGTHPVAMTGLAGLALIASGSTPNRGPYAAQVRKAVKYCLSKSQPNGLITSPHEEMRSMYGHGFSMLFLAQAYGMETDLKQQAKIETVLNRAIQLTARSQSRDGGWLYTPDSQSDEGSVTVTQVQALRACRNAGLFVPKKTIANAIKYIENSQNPDGGISYSVRSRGNSRPAITAAACAVMYNAGKYDSKSATRCWKYAWQTCQPTGQSWGHRFYTQLYMSQATWQKGGKFWARYYPTIRDQMIGLQQGNGSWQGDGVGPVYGTAVALLILQLPYQHLPILSR